MNRHSLLAALEDPNRAWFVLIVGLLMIYRECTAPGRILPGVLGGVAAAVSIYSLFQKPWSVTALSLILLGIALLIAQAFWRQFWVALVVAALLVTAGAHLLTTPRIGIFPALLGIPLSGITGFLLRTAVLARRNKVSIE
jgi:membrane-bound serine protease (ClpP class)